MHTVFLHHARLRGMDMAIINPSTSLDIETVDPALREAIEDVIFMRREDATSRLSALAQELSAQTEKPKGAGRTVTDSKSEEDKQVSLASMVISGNPEGLEKELERALSEEGSAMGVIKNRLMVGMNKVGEAFGAGRMFLPQVVRSAGVMKRAISWLTPHIEDENRKREQDCEAEALNGTAPGQQDPNSTAANTFILATVKGDVHDIGKNIVAVVLRCSGFEVIDLGVMVPKEKIIDEVKRTGAKFVGLSGLITPSLSEMVDVARALEDEGLKDTVLFVGGATTSAVHTAVKIAPEFSGSVIHTTDAASLVDMASKVKDESTRELTLAENRKRQEEERIDFERRNENAAPKADRQSSFRPADTPMPEPIVKGTTDFEIGLEEVEPLINWKAFNAVWRIPNNEETEESKKLRADAEKLLDELKGRGFRLRSRAVILPARREGDDIIIVSEGGEEIVIPTIRQEAGDCLAVADFVAPGNDWIALFCATVSPDYDRLKSSETDDYRSLLFDSLGDRLVEAATEYTHRKVHHELWSLTSKPGPRPAIGYPSLPDQTLTKVVSPLLRYDELGVTVTENGALSPSSTTTGFIFAYPSARYFDIGLLSEGTFRDYAFRRHISEDELQKILPRHRR